MPLNNKMWHTITPNWKAKQAILIWFPAKVKTAKQRAIDGTDRFPSSCLEKTAEYPFDAAKIVSLSQPRVTTVFGSRQQTVEEEISSHLSHLMFPWSLHLPWTCPLMHTYNHRLTKPGCQKRQDITVVVTVERMRLELWLRMRNRLGADPVMSKPLLSSSGRLIDVIVPDIFVYIDVHLFFLIIKKIHAFSNLIKNVCCYFEKRNEMMTANDP